MKTKYICGNIKHFYIMKNKKSLQKTILGFALLLGLAAPLAFFGFNKIKNKSSDQTAEKAESKSSENEEAKRTSSDQTEPAAESKPSENDEEAKSTTKKKKSKKKKSKDK